MEKKDTAKQPSRWLARSEQILIFILIAFGLILVVTVRCLHVGQENIDVKGQANPNYKVNINSADWVTLALVPGIGEGRAKAIIKHRNDHGPFKKVDDLTHINGIGEKVLAKIRPYMTVCDSPLPSAGLSETQEP